MDKSKSFDAVMLAIEKHYGNSSIRKLGRQEHWPSISTGVLSLDYILGNGGLPCGRIVELYGREGSAKSTLSLSLVAQAQKLGKKCLYIDAEYGLDPSYIERLGVDVDDLIYIQPATAEDAFGMSESLINTGDIGVVVIDSVAALVPKKVYEGEIGDQNIALLPRLLSQSLPRLAAEIAETGTILVLINQVRVDMKSYIPKVGTPGGHALKHMCSVRIQLYEKTKIKNAIGEIIGTTIEATTIKNRMYPPQKKASFDLFYHQGFSHFGCLVDLAEEKDILQKGGGGYYKYNDLSIQGRDKMVAYLSDNPELAEEIKGLIFHG